MIITWTSMTQSVPSRSKILHWTIPTLDSVATVYFVLEFSLFSGSSVSSTANTRGLSSEMRQALLSANPFSPDPFVPVDAGFACNNITTDSSVKPEGLDVKVGQQSVEVGSNWYKLCIWLNFRMNGHNVLQGCVLYTIEQRPTVTE